MLTKKDKSNNGRYRETETETERDRYSELGLKRIAHSVAKSGDPQNVGLSGRMQQPCSTVQCSSAGKESLDIPAGERVGVEKWRRRKGLTHSLTPSLIAHHHYL